MKAHELKPCPFCGCEPELRKKSDKLVAIVCPASSSCADSGLAMAFAPANRDKAVAQWNRRAAQATVKESLTTEQPLSRDQIRDVFLGHGFTIKPGHDDLKPYVYEAAEALLAAAGVNQQLTTEQPEADCYSNDDGDTWHDCPDDIEFVQGLSVGDEYELLASVRAWPERFRVIKVPDETDDEYRVEPVRATHLVSMPLPVIAAFWGVTEEEARKILHPEEQPEDGPVCFTSPEELSRLTRRIGPATMWAAMGVFTVPLYPASVKAERDALRERVKELEADAKRYRWLRNEAWAQYNAHKGTPEPLIVVAARDAVGNIKTILAEDGLDASVDTAMQEGKS